MVEVGHGGERTPSREVKDLWPRLLISPVLGLIITNLSGLIDNSRHTPLALLASYVYFAFVAFVVWTGNRALYFRLQRREEWLQRPAHRLSVLIVTILLYSVPVAWLLMWIWQQTSGDPGTRAYAIPTALLGTVTVVVAITHVYETVFLLRDWESDRLRSARMERARLEAELEALGREVDPHFLFNNLNALAHLVDQQRNEAPAFINALSATYQYVLDSRGKRLVPLAEELAALRRHEMLAAIRFGKGVMLRVDMDEELARRFQLPPVTLGELFQNAIKHNTASPEAPLCVCIHLDGPTLVFENEVRTRVAAASSTGFGLKNLSERCQLATGRAVSWGVEGGRFVIRLPLVG
jgi:hypothetical protein